jgi:peptidoglycan/LPS O-acetylase OafA/YrhL
MQTTIKTRLSSSKPEVVGITQAATTGRQRFDALTALRFFPLFCVIFHHWRQSFACLRGAGECFNFSQATSFFFVFSGFVLAHNYLRLEGSRETWRFYCSRFSRIWPMHVFSLLLLIALLPEHFRVKNTQLPTFLCNLALVQAWIPSWKTFFSYNAPSWTCSTLAAMYLLFPILARTVRSCWYLVLSGAVALVFLSVMLCNALGLPECQPVGWSQLGVIYIHPVCRLLEFVVGMVAAFFFRDIADRVKPGLIVSTVLEAGIIALIIWLNISTSFLRAITVPTLTNAGSLWLSYDGIPMIPCVLLVVFVALGRGLISKLLSRRFFVILGEISFAMFLIHGILLAYHDARCPFMNQYKDAGLFMAVLFGASYLMTVLYERPVRKLILNHANRFLFTDQFEEEGRQPAAMVPVHYRRPEDGA